MAAANDPLPPGAGTPSAAEPGPGGIQPAPQVAGVQEPPGEAPIKLPPAPPRPVYVREGLAQGVARLNQALVAVVLVLGFLLASFAVRNQDFWMSLATGRALAHGQYQPWTGQDPFAYTTAGTYWANHAWLFDLAVYEAYEVLGGPALVVLKGLLVAVLAWVLIQVRRPGEDAWLPAACTGLALVVLSPRLFLQPVLLSYLFLAITLWLLLRPARDEADAATRQRPDPVWLLPPLFVLWVNVDGWFFVGLLAVALVLLGEILQGLLPFGPRDGGRSRLPRLALVLLLSAAACLVNPHTYHAFTVPAELSPGQPTSLLAGDKDFHWYFTSPLTESYWNNPNLGRTAGGLALVPLVLLGLVSFALNGAGWRWRRALLWLAFLLLAAYRWHAVAFFAVVAGPVMALNFQDVLARRRAAAGAPPLAAPTGLDWAAVVKIAVVLAVVLVGLKLGARTTFFTEKLARLGWPEPPVVFLVFAGFVIGVVCFGLAPTLAYFDRVFTTGSLGGRVLTLLAGAALLVAAWPGWLGTSPRDPDAARRVTWDVEPDQSLRQLAEWLGRARQTGALDHGFATMPQVVSYCAWFCPEEQGFFDHRFGLFAGPAATFLDVRDTVTGAETAAGKTAADRERRERRLADCFRRYHINHVIVAANDPASAWQRCAALLDDPRRWTLLYLDGHHTVFGWNDPEGPGGADPWAALAYRPNRLAFGPPSPAAQAPEQGQRDPIHVPAWAHYVVGPPRPDLASDEAALHLLHFQMAMPRVRQESDSAWEAVNAAAVVTGVAPAAGSVGGAGLLAYRTCLAGFVLSPDATAQAADFASRDFGGLAEAQQSQFLYWRDDGPPALALLAVRAARRAAAANPQDALTYVRLEQAYAALDHRTGERAWRAELPELVLLRQVQMITALERALTVQPDLAAAHLELGDLYGQYPTGQNPEMGYIDLRLKHLRAALTQLRRAGPQPPETPDEFENRLKPLDQQVQELQKTVQRHLNQFEVSSPSMRVYDKAVRAFRLGLAEQALDTLQESNALEFGQKGAQLQFELLLTTGRAGDVRQILTDDLKGKLGMAYAAPGVEVPAYEWYRTLLAAADGDYGEADQMLEEIADQDDPRTVLATRLERLKQDEGRAKEPDPVFAARLLGRALEETPQEKPLAWLALNHLERVTAMQTLFSFSGERQEQAELLSVRGLLALEAGKTDGALDVLHQTMSISLPPARCAPLLSLLGARSPLEAAVLVGPGYRASLGPVIDFHGRPVSLRYVKLMEQAAAGKDQ